MSERERVLIVDDEESIRNQLRWGLSDEFEVLTAANADEAGARADNPDRALLGATQLAWVEQTLLTV